ncbi:MAG: formate--tetrahydrofolate ligase [Acidobacteriota bacterium]
MLNQLIFQNGNLNPSLVILVTTVRALKMHGGIELSKIKEPDTKAVKRGLPKSPIAERIDIDESGNITGLF